MSGIRILETLSLGDINLLIIKVFSMTGVSEIRQKLNQNTAWMQQTWNRSFCHFVVDLDPDSSNFSRSYETQLQRARASRSSSFSCMSISDKPSRRVFCSVLSKLTLDINLSNTFTLDISNLMNYT